MEWKKEILTIILMIFLSACNPFKKGQVSLSENDENLLKSKICVIGNTGLYNSDELLVIEALKKENCGTFIHLGNMIQNTYTKKMYAQNFEAKFLSLYRDLFLDKEVFVVVGETEDNIGVDYINSLIPSEMKLRLHKELGVKVYNDLCLFIANTNLNYRSGQDILLTQELKKKRNCKLKITIGFESLEKVRNQKFYRKYAKKFVDKIIVGNTDYYLSSSKSSLVFSKLSDKTKQFIIGSSAFVESSDYSKFGSYYNDLGYMTIEKELNSEGQEVQKFKLKTVDTGVVIHTKLEEIFKP